MLLSKWVIQKFWDIEGLERNFLSLAFKILEQPILRVLIRNFSQTIRNIINKTKNQTGYFRFGMSTSLGEGSSEFKPVVLCLKNNLVLHPA